MRMDNRRTSRLGAKSASFAFAAELELLLVLWELVGVTRSSVSRVQLLSHHRLCGCYRASDLHDGLMKLVYDGAVEPVETTPGSAFFLTNRGRNRALHFMRTSGVNSLSPIDRVSLATARSRAEI